MDIGRTCFVEQVRPWSDSNETILIRWYFAKPGAKIFDGTSMFASPVFDTMEGGYNPVKGVQVAPFKRLYNKGSNLFRPDGQHYHGTKDDFFRGNLYASRVPFDGNPPGLCQGTDKLAFIQKEPVCEALVEKIGTRYGGIELVTTLSGPHTDTETVFGRVTVAKETTGRVAWEQSVNGLVEVAKQVAGVKHGTEEIIGGNDPGLSLNGRVAWGQSVRGHVVKGLVVTGNVSGEREVSASISKAITPTGAFEEEPVNYAINGGFDFFQRQAPATATRRANNTYGPDRWVILTNDTGTSDPSGSSNAKVAQVAGDQQAVNALKFLQSGATAKYQGIVQWLEAADTFPLRARQLTLSVLGYSPGSYSLRLAVIAWNGTADSLGSARDPVADWSHANDADPRTSFLKSTSISQVDYTAATSVSGAWTQLSMTFTTTASMNNLGIMVWCPSTVANTDYLQYGRVLLNPGSVPSTWSPRPAALELAACERFFEKGYPLAVAPASTFSTDTQSITQGIGVNGGPAFWFPFRQRKRVAPTFLFFDTLGASGKITTYDGSFHTGVTFAPTYVQDDGFDCNWGAAYVYAGWTADAEL